jgi:hypothetical protein
LFRKENFYPEENTLPRKKPWISGSPSTGRFLWWASACTGPSMAQASTRWGQCCNLKYVPNLCT